MLVNWKKLFFPLTYKELIPKCCQSLLKFSRAFLRLYILFFLHSHTENRYILKRYFILWLSACHVRNNSLHIHNLNNHSVILVHIHVFVTQTTEDHSFIQKWKFIYLKSTIKFGESWVYSIRHCVYHEIFTGMFLQHGTPMICWLLSTSYKDSTQAWWVVWQTVGFN